MVSYQSINLFKIRILPHGFYKAKEIVEIDQELKQRQ